MAESSSAPYATPTNVLTVIGRYRERGLPDPITRRTLESLGITYSVTGHVLGALRFLSLIDGEGHRTDQFERLRRATTDEYREVLAEIIRAAYHEVLTIVDPVRDSITAINDAFRHFEPAAQRDRMVTLFLGLCREAGIGPEKRRLRPVRQETTPSTQQRRPRATGGTMQGQMATATAGMIPGQLPASGDQPSDGTPDYRLLNVLLQQLPREGRWSRERREKWLQAMQSAVDLVVEVTEN